jgi:hypothetical protein
MNNLLLLLFIIGCILLILPTEFLNNYFTVSQKIQEITGVLLILISFYYYNNQKLF